MNKVVLKDGTKAVIREVNLDDAVQLVDIQLSIAEENLYMVSEPDEFHLTATEERQRIQMNMENSRDIQLVAEIERNIVGFAVIRNETKKRKVHIGALGIFIQKEWRGAGVGGALMNAILELVKNNPLIHKIGLAVFANNESAIRLYKKLGFVEEGRRVREIRFNDEYVDEILMYKLVST